MCIRDSFYTWTALDVHTYNSYCDGSLEGVEMNTESRHFSALFVNLIPNSRNQSVRVRCRLSADPIETAPKTCECGSENVDPQKIVVGTVAG